MRNLLRLLTIVAVFASAILLPVVAFGDSSPPDVVALGDPAPGVQAWWQTLVLGLLPYIIEAASLAITFVVLVIGRRFKLKLEREDVYAIAEKAIGYGHQYAKRKLKANEPVDGSDVKAKAVAFALKQAEISGLGKKAISELEDLLEGTLGLENSRKEVVASTPKEA